MVSTLCKLSLYSSVSPLPKATIMTLFLPKKNLWNKWLLYGSKCDVNVISSKKPPDWLSSLPAVFPSRSDILNFVIPHIRHRKNEQVSVGVHTLAQLQSQTRIKASNLWLGIIIFLTLQNRPQNPYLRDQFLFNLQSFLDCFR